MDNVINKLNAEMESAALAAAISELAETIKSEEDQKAAIQSVARRSGVGVLSSEKEEKHGK